MGLKLLQYLRDEAHRFAQHYHHILRRKSQLEENVKKCRKPPRAKRAQTKRFGQLTPLPQNEQGLDQPQPLTPAPAPIESSPTVQETHVRPPETSS